jgi:hypothetical protein
MNTKALDYVLGQDWIAVVGKNGTSEFATAFVTQPVLHSSVLNAPCIGVEPIAAFFAVTSGMYDRLAFIHETKDSSKICLEWEGKVFGEDVEGTTILTRNDTGPIDTDNWDPKLTNGFAAERDVILVDNAGVGSSSGETPSTVAAMTKDCADFCRALA